MTPHRLLCLAFLAGSLAGACAKDPAPGSPISVPPDTGVADVSPSTTPAGPEAGAPAACPPGASAEDCQRCQYGGETCTRACPKVNCDAFPPPAACASFCGKMDCCECRLEVGTEYWWRPAQHPIVCRTSCGAMRLSWQDLMKDPRMKACTVDQDCVQAGGPIPVSCDCRPAIGGGSCFQSVNAAAYQSLGAAALESVYLTSCSGEPGICDCAPGVPGCQNGTCVMKEMFCCNCPPGDGGR